MLRTLGWGDGQGTLRTSNLPAALCMVSGSQVPGGAILILNGLEPACLKGPLMPQDEDLDQSLWCHGARYNNSVQETELLRGQ